LANFHFSHQSQIPLAQFRFHRLITVNLAGHEIIVIELQPMRRQLELQAGITTKKQGFKRTARGAGVNGANNVLCLVSGTALAAGLRGEC
jgi:hypothetical protein